jgi:type II restriction enzyme
MANRDKSPADWQLDIDRSVAEYNEWYLANSPTIWATARGRAVEMAAAAMDASRDFRDFSPRALRAYPRLLVVARAAVSPTMARARLIGFAGVNGNVVKAMEIDNVVPPRGEVGAQLARLCDFLADKLDPGLFPWALDDRDATREEKDKALLLLGDRLTLAYYNPELRNEQERRQKRLMREHLASLEFQESAEAWDSLMPGTFGMGRNVPGRREDGGAQNLPTDCVIRPAAEHLPLVALEMKSAGDFTNVNKRRKEESDKKTALGRMHGESVIMLLQLFGYFDRGYLEFEAAAGLDWAWDHRLSDLDVYLGV